MNMFKVIAKIGLTAIIATIFIMSLSTHKTFAEAAVADPGNVLCEREEDINSCGNDYPYFVIMGGDAVEGNKFASLSSPSTTTGCEYNNQSLTGWNTNGETFPGTASSTATGNYYGAAVQDGATTNDVLHEVVTNLDSDLPGGNSAYSYPGFDADNDQTRDSGPGALGFANHDTNPGSIFSYFKPYNPNQDVYGGLFGPLPCQPDYSGLAMASNPPGLGSALTGNVVNLDELSGGTYSYTETDGKPLIITTPNPITQTKPITIAVNGNVYIDSNITYNYSSPTKIPELNVYAYGKHGGQVTPTMSNTYGNISVDESVNEIHGFFVAQGNDGENPNYFFPGAEDYSATGWIWGLFSTCATIDQTTDVITNTADYNTCNSQLTVDGSVAAVAYWLERDHGSVSDLSNQPTTSNAANAAEVFRYSPEVWLPYVTNANCSADISSCLSSSSIYQAEVSLPPVL